MIELTNLIKRLTVIFQKKTVRLYGEDRFFMTGKIKGLLKKRETAFKHGRKPILLIITKKRVAFEIR